MNLAGFNMGRPVFDVNTRLSEVVTLWLCLVVGAAGCASSHSEDAAAAPRPEMVFKSPGAAVDALVAALRAGDIPQLRKIFGPAGDQIVSSGDPVADRQQVARFLAAYDQRHRLEAQTGGTDTTLEIVPDD